MVKVIYVIVLYMGTVLFPLFFKSQYSLCMCVCICVCVCVLGIFWATSWKWLFDCNIRADLIQFF